MLPWSTYTGTKPETADTAKEYLQRISLSPTRRDFRFARYNRPVGLIKRAWSAGWALG